MIRTVYLRKLYIDKQLGVVKAMPNNKLKHDTMCNSYVLVCGSIEYMIESIIRGWLKHNIKKHRYNYPKKKHVDDVIDTLYNNAEVNLYNNHTIDYDKICSLIKTLAGDQILFTFKANVRAASPAGAEATISALKRISLLRHMLAHGINTTTELSPNISELENDFNTIYKNLVENLDTLLARR